MQSIGDYVGEEDNDMIKPPARNDYLSKASIAKMKWRHEANKMDESTESLLINNHKTDNQPQKSRLGFLKNGGIPADLSKLPRCTATAKHSGKRCKRIALRGKTVCQFHGGRGGAPSGKKNGAYKHGRYTKEAFAKKKRTTAITKYFCSVLLGKGMITEEQAGTALTALNKKRSGYIKKKPDDFIPVKKRKYFCVFQKGGGIWGIGTTEEKAISDAEWYIDDEFMLYEAQELNDCPKFDYVVIRCTKTVYDLVDKQGGGIRYRIVDGACGLQVRKNITWKPGPKSKRYVRRARSKYLPV